jgi:hypothetical protein
MESWLFPVCRALSEAQLGGHRLLVQEGAGAAAGGAAGAGAAQGGQEEAQQQAAGVDADALLDMLYG